MENKEQAEETNLSNEENISSGEHAEGEKHSGGIILIIPLLLSIYLFLGFTNVDSKKQHSVKRNTETAESEDENSPKINFSALLAPEERKSWPVQTRPEARHSLRNGHYADAC